MYLKEKKVVFKAPIKPIELKITDPVSTRYRTVENFNKLKKNHGLYKTISMKSDSNSLMRINGHFTEFHLSYVCTFDIFVSFTLHVIVISIFLLKK